MSRTSSWQLDTEMSDGRSYNRLDMVKEWLNQNYIVRVNLLDRSKVSLSPTPECAYHYEFPVTENDILLHAYADELKISEKNLP